MKTCYFYKRYRGGRISKKIYAIYRGNTEHECWRKLMEDEKIEELHRAKSRFKAYLVPVVEDDPMLIIMSVLS